MGFKSCLGQFLVRGHLQDEIRDLKDVVANVEREIAATKSTETQDYRANSQDIREIFSAIDEIDQQLGKIKPARGQPSHSLHKHLDAISMLLGGASSQVYSITNSNPPSHSRKGNPYDNAFAESFIKTLKYEEVYLE
jgi:hypothetical protein